MPHSGANEEQEQQLQTALADCVFDSSWFWCLAGVLVAVPLGVKTRSYAPLLYLGAGGTALDLLQGWNRCQPQRAALAAYQQSLKDDAAP
jgi:hypothetical protein